MTQKLKVLVADDHKLFRIGLTNLLSQMEEIESVLQAENGQKVMEILSREAVDIIFMDVSMPELNGCQTTRLIKERYPKVLVIALSMFDDKNSVLEMIAYGARGYLTKNTDIDEIKLAISTVMEGEKYFTPEIAKNILKGVYSDEKEIIHLRKLGIITSQEKQILKLLSDGLKSETIGLEMGISPKTVEGHKAMLFRKTGTNNVASLIKYAFRNKIIEW